MNKLQPGSVKKINTGSMAFKLMENIGNFLEAAATYGVPKADLFQTVDLYEAENIPQVCVAMVMCVTMMMLSTKGDFSHTCTGSPGNTVTIVT